ncbi:Hypothetical protein PHPALM_13384, partial [Phytophthora palmivora]
MAFRCVGSPLEEMKRLEKLREWDPESAANLVANGKLLVEFAQNGNLRALQCAVEHLEEVEFTCGQVLIFYVVRMFREACATSQGIEFQASSEDGLQGYSDADWAGDIESRR